MGTFFALNIQEISLEEPEDDGGIGARTAPTTNSAGRQLIISWVAMADLADKSATPSKIAFRHAYADVSVLIDGRLSLVSKGKTFLGSENLEEWMKMKQIVDSSLARYGPTLEGHARFNVGCLCRVSWCEPGLLTLLKVRLSRMYVGGA